MLKLFFLGRPYLEVDGKEIRLRRRKNLALLAYLVLAEEPCRREELMALLWPELDTHHAQTALRRDLWVLRNTIPTVEIAATTETLALPALQTMKIDQAVAEPKAKQEEAEQEEVGQEIAQEIWCDVLAFRALIAAHRRSTAQSTHDAEENRDLVTAVQLYRADFLHGFTLRDSVSFDEWQRMQSEALRHELFFALEQLVQYYRSEGQSGPAITYLQRILEIDPLYEEAHYQLMALYAETGRNGTALQQFERWKTLLADELGVTPSEQMMALYVEIETKLQQHSLTADNANQEFSSNTSFGYPSDHTHSPPDKSHHAPQIVNLPTPATPFVGRKQEVDQVCELLAVPECRLLTLLGPGGIGKTRLALAAATEISNIYTDGVHFVSLVGLRHPQFLAEAILESLNVMRENDRSPQETLAAYLQERLLLLVLDNFEHLIDAAPLLRALLTQTKRLKLLVTSRIRLNTAEEWLFPLEGMVYPAQTMVHEAEATGALALTPVQDDNYPMHLVQQYDAVAFFLATAKRLQPAITFTPSEIRAIREICQLVEGVPLALELAVAWLMILPCTAIAAELRKNLDLLMAKQDGVIERHESLRATLDYSWRLTSTPEQIVLAKLAVFQGGFLPTMAQAVADVDPPMLRTLADKSWLHRTANNRIEMHEFVRQYCRARLENSVQDPQQIYRRHAQAYSWFLQEYEEELRDQRQLAAVQAIVSELDNIRAAWVEATLQGDSAALHGLLHSFYLVGIIRNWHTELSERFSTTIATFTATTTQTTRTEQHILSISLLLLRLHTRLARSLVDLGLLNRAETHCKEGWALLTEIPIPIQQRAEWRQEIAFLHAVNGLLLVQSSPQPAVQEHSTRAQELLPTLLPSITRDEIEIITTFMEAEAHFAAGERNAAIALLTGQAARFRQRGERWLRTQLLTQLVFYLRVKNETVLMQQYTEERLTIYRALNDQRGIAYCLSDLGYHALFGATPDLSTAQHYFDEMLAVSDTLRNPIVRSDTLFAFGQLAYFQERWDAARSYLYECAEIAQAGKYRDNVTLAHLWLGEIALVESSFDEADYHFYRVLEDAVASSTGGELLLGIEGLAKSCLQRGEITTALPILYFIVEHPGTWEYARGRVREILARLEATLPKKSISDAVEIGRTLQMDDVVVWGKMLRTHSEQSTTRYFSPTTHQSGWAG